MPINHVNITDEQRERFGKVPLVARHELSNRRLFTNEALVDLLDRHPRDRLFALTMGTDPERHTENRLALLDDVSGEDLLKAVERGRLWLNITYVDQSEMAYRELVQSLYHDLSAQIPGFRPTVGRGTLLLSSPGAMVYYHVDGPPSLLWHLRGRKRVWVYPGPDERFVSRDHLEDVMAGAAHEYAPYSSEFDQRATVFDLEPGDVATWPQNAPHRIVNLEGVNVSLSTEHFTLQSRRRARLYCANRFLRLTAGYRPVSTSENSLPAWIKVGLHRAYQLTGRDRTRMKRHTASVRIDPSAPLGCVPLGAPVDITP